MSENFIKSAFQDPWRWRRVAVTSVVCVTSMGRPLAKETSSPEKHQRPEKIRDLRFHIEYKLGQNYFSPLEIQEYAGRMVKAELRESRVLHMTGHSLGSQTSTVVIQLEQDINTLHNTQGIKAKSTEAAEGKWHPECSIMWVQRGNTTEVQQTTQSGMLYH